MKRLLMLLALAATSMANTALGQDAMKDCPMHAQHQGAKHQESKPEMDKRGAVGMGFSQETTTHHFLLRKDGGAIQVTANSAEDKASVAQIRKHFEHISRAFQAGDFDIPMFVHEQTPPGVPAMKKLKDKIQYKYEELEGGARVSITSGNAEAIEAIHQFLRFQIQEHETGDPQELK